MEKKTIDPMLMVDKAIDMSIKLAGTEFPVSIFPSRIQRIIREVHECHSYPTDYIAASILTAIAVGIGNTHLVQIKQGWQESPILYMALIGRPGANKSHPLSFAMKPFLDFDYQQNQEYEKAYAEYERQMAGHEPERTDGMRIRAIPVGTRPQTFPCIGRYARRTESYPRTEQTWTLPVGGRTVRMVQEL